MVCISLVMVDLMDCICFNFGVFSLRLLNGVLGTGNGDNNVMGIGF